MPTIQLWYPGAIRHNSPWQDVGEIHGRIWPDLVTIAVQHHTAGTANSVIETFGPNSSRHVSAHFMITRDARVHQFVPLDNIAWHAGDWDTNVHSVGFEHEQFETNDPDLDDGTGWSTFTEAQLRKSADVQRWCRRQMPAYLMRPHSDFSSTTCPGDLPIKTIEEYMNTPPNDVAKFTDPVTKLSIYHGMAARWQQLLQLLGMEIYLVVGHIVQEEADLLDENGHPTGHRYVLFEHQRWTWKDGQAPSRYDVLADILFPFDAGAHTL